MKFATKLLAVSFLSLMLSACFVYKIDIQQGNEITSTMLAEIKIGMSQEEVVEVLGYPLVNDPFHTDRWDYYFYLKKGASGEVQQHSATLYFADDKLSEIKSDLLEKN